MQQGGSIIDETRKRAIKDMNRGELQRNTSSFKPAAGTEMDDTYNEAISELYAENDTKNFKTDYAKIPSIQPQPGQHYKTTTTFVPTMVDSGAIGGLNSRDTSNKTTVEYKPTTDTSTAWANTWGTNKEGYNREINSLSPWQQGQLRDDVIADNAGVEGMDQYKNDLPKFIEQATNEKVGVVHNAIAARQPKLLVSQDVKLGITGAPGLASMKRPLLTPEEPTTRITTPGQYDPDRPRAKEPKSSTGFDFTLSSNRNVKTRGTLAGAQTIRQQDQKRFTINGRAK